jgi:hypothetical protein
MSIKLISELEGQKQQATSEFELLSKQAQSLFDSGDQLGAAKVTQKAQQYVDLVNEADLMIGNQKENITRKLADGSFLNERDPMEAPLTTSEGIDTRLAKGLAAVIGQPVNMQSELGWEDRKNLAFLTDPSKDEYLKGKYGEPNVKTMNVMGAPVRLINDGSGWFPVDRYDLTSKDFADAIGEIVPMAGSVVGGIGGAALSKTPAGTSIGSAAGYTAAGTLQDSLAKAVLGAGEGFGNSIMRRSTEAMIGLPIEYGVTKIGGALLRDAATMRKGAISERTNLINEAGEFLAKEGYPTSLARFASGSVESQERMLRAAQNLPNSKIGQDLAFGAKRLAAFMSDEVPRANLPTVLYDDAIKALKADQDLYLKQVAISDNATAQILRRSASEEMQKQMYKPKIDEGAAALYLKESLGKGKAVAEQAKKDVYDSFYQEADSLVSVNPIELAERIERSFYGGASRPVEIQKVISNLRARPQNANKIIDLQKKIDGGKLSPEAESITRRKIQELEEVSGPLSASQLDEQVRIIRDQAPSGPVAGSGANELKRASSTAERVVTQFRDDVYKKQGLYDKWSNATNKYQNFLDYTQTNLAKILESKLGKTMTSGDIMKAAYKSSEDTNLILSAIKRDDPSNFPAFERSMQESYLNKIGLNGRQLGSSDGFDFDERIVRELFDSGTGVNGQRMVNKLNGLQSYFKAQKLDPSKITLDDLKQLEGVVSQDSIKEITSSIASRVSNQQNAEKLGRNVLIKDVLNGHKESITRGEFPKALYDAEPAQVKKVFSKLNTAEQKAIREDFAEYVFSRYPGDPDSTAMRLQLWDGDRFLKDVAANPKLKQNMEIALGEDFVNRMTAASRLTEATRTVSNGAGIKPTGVVTEKGARGFIPIGPVMNSIGTRATAAMYRAGSLFPLLGKMAQKELTQEQFQKETSKALGTALLTANGIQATLQTGKYDPEWSRRLGQTLGTASKDSIDYAKAFGYGTRF